MEKHHYDRVQRQCFGLCRTYKEGAEQMKKTGFAARLEAMQKQQELLQQQRQNKK